MFKQYLHTTAVLGAMVLALAEVAGAEGVNLIDRQQDPTVEWMIVNDGVMGGVSRSRMLHTESGHYRFTGKLSLENDGGFASVRAILAPVDLSQHDGVELRVRGDGRRYQLRLRSDAGFDGVAHRAYFDTQPGEWISVRIPFHRFVPSFRGRIVRNAPPLDRTHIRQISFLLADKQPGAFELEIESVGAYGEARVP